MAGRRPEQLVGGGQSRQFRIKLFNYTEYLKCSKHFQIFERPEYLKCLRLWHDTNHFDTSTGPSCGKNGIGHTTKERGIGAMCCRRFDDEVGLTEHLACPLLLEVEVTAQPLCPLLEQGRLWRHFAAMPPRHHCHQLCRQSRWSH